MTGPNVKPVEVGEGGAVETALQFARALGELPEGSSRNLPPAHNIAALLLWAQMLMASRPADYVIGEDYLRRWYVVPRNPWCNVYLHQIMVSDDDRALHDHPWRNTSIILDGEYIEHMGGHGPVRRKAGDVVQRSALALHRLEIEEGARPVITLFVTGPKVRDWGFACPKGWVPWQEFTSPTDARKTGRGCGEDDQPQGGKA